MGYDTASDLDHLAAASACPATRRALAARLLAEQEYRAALAGVPAPTRLPTHASAGDRPVRKVQPEAV